MGYRKKLIEVALPLETINRESAREKSIRHGHPSTLHLWWARRPLAACRAVLFASLVDDPSSVPEEFPTEEDQERERQRLFRILEELVPWEHSNRQDVLDTGRAEIARSVARQLGVDCPRDPAEVRRFLAEKAPPVYDPFCGGGSIPLEAQRLGLRAYASDLNPVAVLITKALIEIPPRFADRPPVNPEQRQALVKGGWTGARGLAEDVRYYGRWMRDQAEKRIGHLYPKVRLPREHGGGEATVIAWLWARTVACPNPACGARMPLVRSFALSTKKGKEAWVEPIVRGKEVTFNVRTGSGKPPEGTVGRTGATCICCGTPVNLEHVRSEGRQGRLGQQLMAIVAEGNRTRVYLDPDEEQARVAASAQPSWTPETDLPEKALGFRVQAYGMTKHRDLFTARQLAALTTFSDLVAEAHERVSRDYLSSISHSLGANDPEVGDYAESVCIYLAFVLSKLCDRQSSLASWDPNPSGYSPKIRTTFSRPTLSMTWDFTEGNPFGGASGNFEDAITWVAKVIDNSPRNCPAGVVEQHDARQLNAPSHNRILSTDPPYYDNVGYADLSDYFYIWLRSALPTLASTVLSTLLVPKEAELVADPQRFTGSSDAAKAHFEQGLSEVFSRARMAQNRDIPASIYYAFKQSESSTEDGEEITGVSSTGWETMLEAINGVGLSLVGTWPVRTELGNRMRNIGSNALASSIVLVCRPRPENAPRFTRRDFLRALKAELPEALRQLQHGNIAPVDMAQASIGPGMAVFSRYSQVLEANGEPMRVRDALALINQVLDEFLAEQEGEYDADTRWALAWYEQHAHNAGSYGDAETLSKAKNTSVNGLVEAGILEAKGGKVRLLKRAELSEDWSPETDPRLPVWELTQRLILELEQGESRAGSLLARVGGDRGERARDLAYRLYSLCERKKWAQEALAYNALVVSWPEVKRLATVSDAPVQGQLV